MEINSLKQLKAPVFYVTNDVSRAIGLEKLLPNYHVVCLDEHPLVDYLRKGGVSVFCLERELKQKNSLRRNSGVVLDHPLTLDFIQKKSRDEKPNILFFKPQKKIELTAQKFGFNLVGNNFSVSHLFEDKTLFYRKCFEENISVPRGEIIKLGEANFEVLKKKYETPLVVQFGRGWAGNTTSFIKTQEELEFLKSKYAAFFVKINQYIDGITVLNNAVILGDDVLVSSPAIQIQPEGEISSLPGATGGRQWPAEISKEQEDKIFDITTRVGLLMGKSGFKGFFGLDFLIEKNSGEVYLSENNARLTASASFYTQLEIKNGVFPLLGYHLCSFVQNQDLGKASYQFSTVSGSEVVGRNTQSCPVRITEEVMPGIYNNKLDLIKKTYSLNTENKDLFWLTTAALGRVVNPEIELLKMNFSQRICDSEGKLFEEIPSLIKSLKEALKLKNVENKSE